MTPSTTPLSQAEKIRVAELQLFLKQIDGEIQAWSSAEAIKKHRALRLAAQAELDSIVRPHSESRLSWLRRRGAGATRPRKAIKH